MYNDLLAVYMFLVLREAGYTFWIQVMFLWIATFWLVGSWIVPFLAHAAGFSKETLTHRGQALYSLLTDITEGLAGIAILHQCLGRFRPLPPGWFEFKLKGRWHWDVAFGCLLFPLVNLLSHINISLVHMSSGPVAGVSSVEQSIVARDPVAMALYALVVTVCAPIWEEIVFRGFLLPSLTRYMPLPWSILLSAAAFALAHFNVQRVLPLIFLGVVMGGVFARSRNLLASMVLHSLWNGFVFLDLMKWAMTILLSSFWHLLRSFLQPWSFHFAWRVKKLTEGWWSDCLCGNKITQSEEMFSGEYVVDDRRQFSEDFCVGVRR